MSDPLQDYALWEMSDEALAEHLASAEAQERASRIRAFECRFHQAVRRNMKKNEIETRIADLEAELASIRLCA